jgi:hypothetical protein
MAEKVIRNNQRLLPFLGERLNFIKGLDPLGLQNSSDATFSMLLPGLNNVTGRMRYYSFYCWLIDEYSKRSGSTNPKDQQQFIRRAEYIIALASQYYHHEISAIPGSLYTSGQIRKEPDFTHKLQEGTFKPNGSTENTYWKFPLGAFGQYYIGSLVDIGIVSRRENQQKIYVRTPEKNNEYISGERLAIAFNTNIQPDKKTLFFDCLDNGIISEAQLLELLPDFDLQLIPADSEEQNLLLRLLLQKDFPLRIEEEPRNHRKTTIKHLLEFISNGVVEFNDRSFIYYSFNNKGYLNQVTQSTLTGWYYYQFNEYWQFANTSILNGALAHLENTVGPNWNPLKSFLEAVTLEIITIFQNSQLVNNPNDSIESILLKLQADEFLNYRAISKSSEIVRAYNGFLLVFSLFLNNENELFRLKEYAENNELAKDGEGTTYFLNEFLSKKALPLKDFIFEYLHKHVVYRHQYVAFRKIRGGIQSTQKFIIEDHHIRYLGNFDPTYTGPRIGNLISFLKDLSLITNDNTLSDKGLELLNELGNGIN